MNAIIISKGWCFIFKILVDADVCPVKNIIVEVAKRNNIQVIMICDNSHIISDSYSTVYTVDQGADSADIALINLSTKNDIIVTQDYGVATLALAKGSRAISNNGLVFNDSNIDTLMMERHLSSKARRGGVRTSKIRKRTAQDDNNFNDAFTALLEECLKNV